MYSSYVHKFQVYLGERLDPIFGFCWNHLCPMMNVCSVLEHIFENLVLIMDACVDILTSALGLVYGLNIPLNRYNSQSRKPVRQILVSIDFFA